LLTKRITLDYVKELEKHLKKCTLSLTAAGGQALTAGDCILT